MQEALDQALFTPLRRSTIEVASANDSMQASPAVSANEQQRQGIAPLQDRPQELYRGRVAVEDPSGRRRGNSRTPRPSSRAHAVGDEPLVTRRRVHDSGYAPLLPGGLLQGPVLPHMAMPPSGDATRPAGVTLAAPYGQREYFGPNQTMLFNKLLKLYEKHRHIVSMALFS